MRRTFIQGEDGDGGHWDNGEDFDSNDEACAYNDYPEEEDEEEENEDMED